MPRPLQVEHAGAVYHVLNRGDRREAMAGLRWFQCQQYAGLAPEEFRR